MTDTSEQVRREFEAWMDSHYPGRFKTYEIRGKNGYISTFADACYRAYLAGRESAGGAEPLATCDLLPTFPHELDNHMGGAKCVNRATPAASQPPARTSRPTKPGVYHADCDTLLDSRGLCPECLLVPDMQSLYIVKDASAQPPAPALDYKMDGDTWKEIVGAGNVESAAPATAPTHDDATLRERALIAELVGALSDVMEHVYCQNDYTTRDYEKYYAAVDRGKAALVKGREAVERDRAIRAGGKG